MRKLFVLLYQPYKWLIYFPFLIVSTLVFGTLAIILSTLMNQKIGSFIGGAVWARLNSYLIPIRVKVTGKDHIENNQSYVIIANHQSQVDIFVLYGWLGIDFKWVLKQELRRIPGLGIGCEKVGHIFIDRADPQHAMTALKAAQPTVVNGMSVLFFPEGTRGTAGKMGEFKKGAFRFALETGLPLLPVTLINTETLLPPHTLNLLPGRVKMIIHEKIEVSGYTPQHLDELMRRAKNTILAGLEKDS